MSIGSVLALLVLLALNGAFVAAEFSLVRSRRERLEEASNEGSRGAAAALRAIEELEASLAACQLGITMMSIGIGFLGEAALAAAIEPHLRGPLGAGAATAIGLLISYLVITVVHITTAEQVPKLYALARPEPTAKLLARPLVGLSKILRPAVWGLSAATNAILRLFGITDTSAGHEDEPPSLAELDTLIARAHMAGRLDPGEAEMLAGVVDLHERCASQVMTPIFDAAALAEGASVLEAITLTHEQGHSRLLVRDESGQVLGVVHLADLAWSLAQQGPDAHARECLRELLVVPETKPLDTLLGELRTARRTLALVADEYGQAAGIVSIEDIIEEIVGDIADETDDEAEQHAPLAPQSDGTWLVPGETGLHELHDAGLPDWTEHSSYQTIGGLVFGALGRLPEVGDLVSFDAHEITVTLMEQVRVAEVRIRRAED